MKSPFCRCKSWLKSPVAASVWLKHPTPIQDGYFGIFNQWGDSLTIFFCKVSKIWHNFQMLQCYGWRLDHPRANILENKEIDHREIGGNTRRALPPTDAPWFFMLFFNGFVPCLVYIGEWFSLCPSLSCIHWSISLPTQKLLRHKFFGFSAAKWPLL